jgi:hypothetical protein
LIVVIIAETAGLKYLIRLRAIHLSFQVRNEVRDDQRFKASCNLEAMVRGRHGW